MKESRFVYKKRTAAQFEAVKSRRGGGFDSYLKRELKGSAIKKYKMRDGKNRVRFLPPTWEDADHFALEIWLNYDVGPDKQSYLSLSRMGKGRDPLAEARLKADKELAKQLAPSRRWVAWVIDRFDAASEAEGPQLMDYPSKLNAAIMTKSQDIDTRDIVFVDHPEEGADVRFYKEGTGKMGTTYPGEKVDVLKTSPLSEDPDQAERWLQFVKAHPIPECLNYYDYDHISAVYNGTAAAPDDEDEDEQHEEKPALKQKSRETPPWKDIEEDEDEPPARAKAKPAAGEDEDNSDAIRDRFRRRVRATEAAED